jgi:ribonucleoside-diphosphate reductase beta chain
MEIAKAYVDYYLPHFQCPEIRMMLLSFASMEATHMNGYSFLNTSLRLPDKEYSEFLRHREMVEKYDYMQSFKQNDPQGIALTLALVSGFIEGMVLFSSFAILMYFSVLRGQFKKSCLHGIGQIVSYSIRDETLHCFSMIKVFHQYVKENIDHINYEVLTDEIYKNADIMLKMEFAFLDLVFSKGELDYVSNEDLKKYLFYMADLRLTQLGLEKQYNSTKNPLPWTETFLYFKELANFFETTPTSYAKGDFIKDVAIDWGNYDNEKQVEKKLKQEEIEEDNEDG